MTAAALVLVEPGAHRPGGHRHRTLAAIATAHGNTVVITPYGVTAETRPPFRWQGRRTPVTPNGSG